RKLRGGADPDVDSTALDLLAEIATKFDRAQLDRPVRFIVTANEFRHIAEHGLLGYFLRGELLWRRNVRHLVLMIERARLIDVKRHHDREDRAAVLDRRHPPGRVALAVAQPLDLVDDRDLRVARQNEIAMQ